MSGPYDRNKVIEIFFRDGWNDTTPVAWPNVKFDPPNFEDAWIRFAMLEGTEYQGSMANVGSRDYIGNGVIIVSVFIKEGKGTKEARELAATVEQIFRGTKATGGVRFRAPYTEDIGSANGWYQLNVTIPVEWRAQY